MGNLLLNGQTAFTQTGTSAPVLASTVNLSNANLSNTTFPAGHPILLSESSSTTAVASVDFDSAIIVPDYKIYILRFHRLIPTTNDTAPFLSFSADNGASFITCRTGRIYTKLGTASSNGGFESNNSTTAGVELSYDNTDNIANRGLQVEVTIFASQDTTIDRCNCNGFAQGINHDEDAYIWRNAGHIEKGFAKINFMRLKYASGTIASHSYSLLGIK